MASLDTAKNVHDCGYVINHPARNTLKLSGASAAYTILFLDETCTLILLTLVTG